MRWNKCWWWTRVHCVHSVDWGRRWAVTNRNPRRVIRSNTASLYFISQVNRFSDIFSFPLGTTILKPRFDLFVAELKRLCQHIPLSNGEILIHHKFFLETFQLKTCKRCSFPSCFGRLSGAFWVPNIFFFGHRIPVICQVIEAAKMRSIENVLKRQQMISV